MIAALNRAISAASKSKVSEWVESTALHLYHPHNKELPESQNFWDHFDKLSPDDVCKIGDTIAKKAVEVEKVALDCIVYDTTNYYN